MRNAFPCTCIFEIREIDLFSRYKETCLAYFVICRTRFFVLFRIFMKLMSPYKQEHMYFITLKHSFLQFTTV